MKKHLIIFTLKNGIVLKGYLNEETILKNIHWWIQEYVSFTIYQGEVQDL